MARPPADNRGPGGQGDKHLAGTTTNGRVTHVRQKQFNNQAGVGRMSIYRVPEVPFAQIANEALRDKRLSFRARGVLAMVLSYSGEWVAGREWLESMTEQEGRQAIQSALNELTSLGYRKVEKANVGGQIRSRVEWSHRPLTDGFLVDQDAVGNTEHNYQNTKNTPEPADAAPAAPVVATEFDSWWATFRKGSPKSDRKPAALKFKAALKAVGIESLTRAAELQVAEWTAADVPADKRAHWSTWLNQARWERLLEADTSANTRRGYSAAALVSSGFYQDDTGSWTHPGTMQTIKAEDVTE